MSHFYRGFIFLLAVACWTGCSQRSKTLETPRACWPQERWQEYYHGVPVSHFPSGWGLRFAKDHPLVFVEGRTAFFRPRNTQLKFACQWQLEKKKFYPGETETGPAIFRARPNLAWAPGNPRSRWFVKIPLETAMSAQPQYSMYCRADKEELIHNFHVSDVLNAIRSFMKSHQGELCVAEDPGYRHPKYGFRNI